MVRQDQFSGFFAEFYDILHAGLGDVEAYLGYARRFGPRILELGSGTGRILIPLARAGFQVTGVDLSDDMMAICRQDICPQDHGRKSQPSSVQNHLPSHVIRHNNGHVP